MRAYYMVIRCWSLAHHGYIDVVLPARRFMHWSTPTVNNPRYSLSSRFTLTHTYQKPTCAKSVLLYSNAGAKVTPERASQQRCARCRPTDVSPLIKTWGIFRLFACGVAEWALRKQAYRRMPPRLDTVIGGLCRK